MTGCRQEACLHTVSIILKYPLSYRKVEVEFPQKIWIGYTLPMQGESEAFVSWTVNLPVRG